MHDENPRPTTAFAEAIRAAEDEEERARLSKLKLELDIASDSPEFIFYATLLPALTRVANSTARTLDDIRDGLAHMRAPLLINPNATATLYVGALLVFATIASFTTYAVTKANDDAAFAAMTPEAARIFATPGGRAALTLLKANGNGLAAELDRCKPHAESGRTALTCTFWGDDTVYALPQSANDVFAQTAGNVAPFALTAAAAGAIGYAIAARRRATEEGPT